MPHWLNNFMFYALGFGTCLLIVAFACMFFVGERADRQQEESYEKRRRGNLESQDDNSLEEIERREVIR